MDVEGPLGTSTLSSSERTLMERLLPFRGGWTLDALELVLRTSWDHLDDPLNVLQALVEKEFVVVEEPLRYRLSPDLEANAGDFDPAVVKVAEMGLFTWADSFCASAGARTTGSEQEPWFDRAELELDNLLAAIDYGTGQPELRSRSLRMAVDLHRFWVVRGHYAVGEKLVESALTSAENVESHLRVKATNLLGVLAMCQGNLDRAAKWLSESLAAARLIGDAGAQGGTLCNLGMIAWERMDFSAARRAFEEASTILRPTDDVEKLGIALLNLGCVLVDMDLPDDAKVALESCIVPLERSGSLGGLAFAEGNLGYLALVRGDRERAFRHISGSLEAFGKLGDWKGTMNTLISAAKLLSSEDLETAATIRGVIDVMAVTGGMAPTPRDQSRLAEVDETLQRLLSPSSIDELTRKGATMSPQHAIDYTLSALLALKSKYRLG